MARKKPDKTNDTEDETGEDTEDAGGSSKVKLIGAVLVLVIVGGLVGTKVIGAGEATPVDANAPTTTTTLPDGNVIVLDPITLNLADGRFLKMGLAIQLAYAAEYPATLAVEGDPTKGLAREVDAVITILGSYTFAELVAPNGKSEAKTALLEQLKTLSNGNIEEVYFHEFVMQ